jgi:hypothetical protein
MAVTKTGTREVVLFKFQVEGSHASISAAKINADGSHGEVFEKKQQVNHVDANGFGHGNVSYPEGYTGSSFIVVQGSHPGSAPDEGTISA